MNMLSFLEVVLGGGLLLAGRKIFWLLVGAIGFIIGVQVAVRFFHGHEIVTIVVGLALGIILAVLAIFLETLAIGIAGFLGGGYILLSLAGLLGLDKGVLSAVIFLAGGILGSLLVALLFNWALITISSLAGASMIVGAFPFQPATAGLIFFILVVVGVAIQGAGMRRAQAAQSQQQNN
jgi:hypothetical protein